MKGIQKMHIHDRKVDYDFELKRNITIIRGDSGTGKTALYNIVASYASMGKESGVHIESTKPCVALADQE